MAVILKLIFLNENCSILIKISLNFVHKGLIDNMSALYYIVTWYRTGINPLPEPMMTQFTDVIYLCVTRPQCVRLDFKHDFFFKHVK